MFTSVRRYKVEESQIGDLMQHVNEQFIPMVSSLPGFVSYQVLDAGDGMVASISVFEDKSGADASNVKAAQWVSESLQAFKMSPPDITEGEVLGHR